MTKFFVNELAAYAGDKTNLRNVEFKKRNFENTAGAEAGTLLEIIPVHIKNPPVIQFIAYLDNLSDNFNVEYEGKRPFGRTNSYYIWKGNDRSITLGFSIPSTSVRTALDNLNNLSWLAGSVYPAYKERMSANSISASPLWRIRYANLIASVTNSGQGILCKFNNLSIGYVIEDGFIHIDATGTNSSIIKRAGFDNATRSGDKILVPKTITINLDLDIIHDHAVGWDHQTGNWRGGLAAPGFPYGFGLERDVKDTPRQEAATSISDPSGAGAEGTESTAAPNTPQALESENFQTVLFDDPSGPGVELFQDK